MRIRIYLFLLLFTYCHAYLLENSVIGQPEVICDTDEIALRFRTQGPFGGKIFVKGFVSDQNCVKPGDQAVDQKFGIAFDQCGIRRERQINGVTIAATVIVSFHTIFITKVDRAYRISCFYMETSKTVRQQLDVSALTTQLLENQIVMPTCRYEILSGGPTGKVAQYARIGETVYHKWTCSSPLADVYCMRVHSCTVVDGQGGSPFSVLDENGCQVDESLLHNLDYIDDLSAGQEALAFKFADKSGLYFNCQIQLTLKDRQYGCSVSQPECTASYPDSDGDQIAVPASATEAENLDELGQGSPYEHQSGYTQRPNDVDSDASLDVSDQHHESGYTTKSPDPQDSSESYPIPPAMTGKDQPSHESPYFRGQKDIFEPEGAPFSAKAKRQKKDVVADFDLPQTSLVVFGLEDEEPVGEHSKDVDRSSAENGVNFACIRTSRVWLSVSIVVFVLLLLISGLLFVIWKQRTLIKEIYVQ
ncbi:unnamed protein product, partial [Mesorhabditis spiculigera]